MRKSFIALSVVLLTLPACLSGYSKPSRLGKDEPRPMTTQAALTKSLEKSVTQDEEKPVVYTEAKPKRRKPENVPAIIDLKDPEFRRRFAESYLATSDLEPAVTAAEREIMIQGLDLIAAEKPEEAEAFLKQNMTPASSAVFDFTLANIYFQANDLDAAAEAYAGAIAKFDKFLRAHKNLGLIQMREGDNEGAVKSLSRVIELGGGDGMTFGLLGFAYSNLENDLAAESAYRMANLLDPATIDWRMGLARSFFKQRRFADAVALIGGLIELDPSRGDLWMLQANAYVGLGETMKAAENFEIADGLGVSTVESLNMLADIYVNEGLFDLAVDSYARAMRMDETRKVARPLQAAKVLTARSALEESARLIDVIEELRAEELTEANRKDLLKIRARLAVAQGADDEEARVLEEIVKLDPLDGEALILLGQHASRGGENEKAIFYYERAGNLEAFEADAKVRHAQLLVTEGKYAEAIPLLKRAQAIKPRENIEEYLQQVEKAAGTRK